jgi:hypothetical protein
MYGVTDYQEFVAQMRDLVAMSRWEEFVENLYWMDQSPLWIQEFLRGHIEDNPKDVALTIFEHHDSDDSWIGNSLHPECPRAYEELLILRMKEERVTMTCPVIWIVTVLVP